MRNVKNIISSDAKRYEGSKLPKFQKYFRLCSNSGGIKKIVYRILYKRYREKMGIEIPYTCDIGLGLYIGHPYGITINPKVKIGNNCNIHKGVTIGQENRGKRQGTPIIGNEVWIGVNATIVGKISIGDDVLIAPNTFVNRDIPSHSICFGNPCQIKSCVHATKNYINNRCDIE